MKTLLPALTLTLASFLLTSCSNITFIGHERAYDLNAQLKPDLSAPVAMNAGFESKSALAVPPETSQPFRDLLNRVKLPDGDVLPTISKLDVTRIAGDATKTASINYVSVLATGQAALAATSNTAVTTDARTGAAVQPATQAAGVLQAMKAISNSSTTTANP